MYSINYCAFTLDIGMYYHCSSWYNTDETTYILGIELFIEHNRLVLEVAVCLEVVPVLSAVVAIFALKRPLVGVSSYVPV